ncbi:translocase of chloroplast 120, chloroplastic-like isoform X2 [Durio zibethinus]|uniref:Translocase of chloroplast 120, chloroplastic-like isoform X2 n=1 Tax=Durio zibethinus TaxID=66656 RepID=A0A6P5XBT5_DURZI|nr:translocase of chloroplast 120, chloroplastic-like isoform X2 [Durio zibethinus]
MENGVGMVDDSVMLDNKIVEERVANEKAEERVVGGSNETMDVEDEVFEEAIGTQEHLQEQTEKFEPQDSSLVADEIGNGETFGDTVSDEVQENSNLEPEAEIFEEALEVPTEIGHREGVIRSDVGPQEDAAVSVDEQKVVELLGGERVSGGVVFDKIDEGGIEMGAGADELNGGKEVPEISGTGEMEVLRDEAEGNLKSYTAIKKPVKGDADKVYLEETLADKNLGTLEGDNVEKDLKMESKLEVLTQEGKGEESREDALATDYQDEKVGDSAYTSAGMIVKLQDDEVVEALNDKSANVDTGDQGKESKEVKGATADLDSVDGGDESEKANKALASVEAVDNRNGEVKDSSDVRDIKHNGEIHEVKDTVSELSTSVEGTAANEFRNLSVAEKFRDEMNEKVEAGKTDLRTEAHDVFQSQPPDEIVDKVQDTHSVTEESDKKAEKGQEDKQSTQMTLEQEVQHAPGSVLSAKAEESGKKVATDQELKQNIPVIREREILPATMPSSTVKSTNSATSPSHPAGLGRAAPLLEPAPRVVQQSRVNGTVSRTQAQQIEDPANAEAEENDETREKLQLIRVKFLRLAHRLGQTPHNVVVAQVLYRLGLAEQLRGRNGGRVGAFSFDRASAMAEQLEAAGNEPLDFSCTIMVLGKTGVGTKKVQDVVGTVHGIKVRVIDTPGLLPSWSDQRQNEKILHSVKHFIKKTPPDIVLYLDRLDMQTRDFGDMPLLRTITEIFGPSIWFNAIVVLTHAASAPPDGPNGTASSYDMFVTQRTHVVQQAIRQAAGDMRLMNPVSLVENHSACRTNRAGQRVLPNGQVWKPHLLLLSFASKILAEANALLKLQDTPPGKPFATRTRAPPLPFLLSSLLQSRPQVKLPEEQSGDDDDLDDDLDESSDSEDESEYDELPPFKRLTKAQIGKLSKAQKKAYFDELEYREKLFMKKQLKEEKKQRKMMKKMAAAAKDLSSEYGDNGEEESSAASSVPVPMPDLTLPASFDSDNPTHRYRYLDSTNSWLVRPVLDTHGWDHDVGYEGINVERLFVAKDKFPISFSGQITKDKKDANVQMELASSLKHGEGKATSLGFDMQTVGKDLAYTMRSETRFSNLRKNKATAGISVTLLGDALSAGVKVEDKLIANKRFQVVMTGGAMTGRGDIAYGGSLEAQLRDKDYPLGRSLSTLGLSVMDWHGDLAIGCNIQSQIPVGRSTNLIARANLNNRGAGQVSIRINSSEQLQLALTALLPLLKKLLDYTQQM